MRALHVPGLGQQLGATFDQKDPVRIRPGGAQGTDSTVQLVPENPDRLHVLQCCGTVSAVATEHPRRLGRAAVRGGPLLPTRRIRMAIHIGLLDLPIAAERAILFPC